jgi:hypothetical protein
VDNPNDATTALLMPLQSLPLSNQFACLLLDGALCLKKAASLIPPYCLITIGQFIKLYTHTSQWCVISINLGLYLWNNRLVRLYGLVQKLSMQKLLQILPTRCSKCDALCAPLFTPPSNHLRIHTPMGK